MISLRRTIPQGKIPMAEVPRKASQYLKYFFSQNATGLSSASGSFFRAVNYTRGKSKDSRHLIALMWALLAFLCLRIAKLCSDIHANKNILLTPDELDLRASILYDWSMFLKKWESTQTRPTLIRALECAKQGYREAANDESRARNATNLLRISKELKHESVDEWQTILLELLPKLEPEKAVQIHRSLAEHARINGEAILAEAHEMEANRMAAEHGLKGK